MQKTASLKKNHEFRRLYSKGKNAVSKYIAVYCRRNGLDGNRLGLTVSTKLGGAVQRNRVRRRLKEVYRLNEHTLRAGFDIVIVARTSCLTAKWSDLQASMMYLFRKLGLLI